MILDCAKVRVAEASGFRLRLLTAAHADAMIRHWHNKVTLGSNILFAPDVHIYAAMHSVDVAERRAGLERAYPVTIGNDGTQCYVFPLLTAA